MFGFLKKKISGFNKKLKEKAEEKAEEEPPEEKTVSEEKAPEETPKKEKAEKEHGVKEKEHKEEKPLQEEVKNQKSAEEEETKKSRAPAKEKAPQPGKKEKIGEEKTKAGKEIEKFEEEIEEREELKQEIKEQEKEPGEKKETEKEEEAKRELKAKVGIKGKLKGRFFGGVEIAEKDVEDLLWELELSLLESDVEQDAAHELTTKIKERIVGKKVSVKEMDSFLNEQIKEILTEMMHTEKFGLIKKIREKEGPYKILFLGPNGAGKTTHIAKLAKHLMDNGLSVIFAAGDTFRAAAIDQLEVHAKKLGVRMVKHQYGSDPAAVAFDAVKAAEANDIDAVLIDSAGRQETNKSLMEELEKIKRVVEPDINLYVGEAFAGQGLLEQANKFEQTIGIDGFILTKIDTDAKGGTTISLLYKLKKPVLYIGTGQEYEDFEEFSPEFILGRIL